MISVFSNSLGAEEQLAVARVMESKWIGEGKECALFEEEFAVHIGATPDTVLLYNSCTSAFYAGLRSLGIGPGDEVIMASINFVACANAVLELGAIPVFADVDPHTLNIIPTEIIRLRTSRTRMVIILHYGGHPAAVTEIREACGPDILLFEDSANSVASTYDGQACGTLGDAGVWSFDAMKILSMGDGGALFLKDLTAVKRAKSLRCLGLANNSVSGKDAMENNKPRWWEYKLETISGRFPSNDLAACIGRVQIKRLSGFIDRRKAIWNFYQQALAGIDGLRLPPEPLPRCTGSYYFYWLQLDEGRDDLAHYLVQNGVYATFRYYPLHLVAYYGSEQRLPNAERVNDTTLNIPIHQNLTDQDTGCIASLIVDYFRNRQR